MKTFEDAWKEAIKSRPELDGMSRGSASIATDRDRVLAMYFYEKGKEAGAAASCNLNWDDQECESCQ